MTLPRKNSRGVDVDGRDFRFLVKHVERWDMEENLSYSDVTVQEVAENPGRVLKFTVPHSLPVTRFSVADTIRYALAAGWDPSERGAAFVFPKEET